MKSTGNANPPNTFAPPLKHLKIKKKTIQNLGAQSLGVTISITAKSSKIQVGKAMEGGACWGSLPQTKIYHYTSVLFNKTYHPSTTYDQRCARK